MNSPRKPTPAAKQNIQWRAPSNGWIWPMVNVINVYVWCFPDLPHQLVQKLQLFVHICFSHYDGPCFDGINPCLHAGIFKYFFFRFFLFFRYLICSFGCKDFPPIITTTNLKKSLKHLQQSWTTLGWHAHFSCCFPIVCFDIPTWLSCVSIPNSYTPRNPVCCENLAMMGDTPS